MRLGDDLEPVRELIGDLGELHAQDLSAAMIAEAAARWQTRSSVRLSCGSALQLSYADASFDAAFHFGGKSLR
jgi:ubiquinone/menaquinone biosynthesis C-methylase UbiE